MRRSGSSPTLLKPTATLAESSSAGRLRRGPGDVQKGTRVGLPEAGLALPLGSMGRRRKAPMALSQRLPAILRSEDKPKDNTERLGFAQMAYDCKLFAAAARLWAEVFAADPKLGDDLRAGHHYNAACAAALAAACQGIDEPETDDATKTKLRRQTLEWLQHELLAWSRQLETVRPQDRQVFTSPLARWKSDPDLASIRDAVALAKLPAEEQRGWRDFWTAVDSLLKNAQSDRP